jgi:tetratricopeptide (TPR) repeat protein
MDDLRDKLLIAWLREEEWGVASFLDLLMRIFRVLLEEYNDTLLKEGVESLYELSPDVAERKAGDLLKDFVGNRTLLIIVENLGELFDGLGDKGQKRLRSYSQENPFSTILATSQSLFNGVSLQTSPFYGFFNINHLQELDLDNATNLLTKIAEFSGDKELTSFIETPNGKSRIRAVHHLAGGSHRVYVIFSQFINRDTLDELVESVMKTLDDLTPYYQARMMLLSPQQRKIAEFLCDRRGAVNVKEIAERCFMAHQTASGQLKVLKDMGYVRPDTVGRESYYELREPLMRLCSDVKKQRGEPIRLLVDFLRIWYSSSELEKRLSMLGPDASLEREYLFRALQISKEKTENPVITACLEDLITYAEKGDFIHALEVSDQLIEIRGSSEDWVIRGASLIRLGRYEDALASCAKAVKIDPEYAVAWSSQGCVYYVLDCHEEALASLNNAIKLDPNSGIVWFGQGMSLFILKRYDEAYASFNKAIELGLKDSTIFFRRAESMLAMNRWDDGIKALEDTLIRFAHADKPDVGNTMSIISNIFSNTQDVSLWRDRTKTLINLYSKYDVLSSLGQGLVRSISDLYSPMVSDTAAQAWLDVWREVGGNKLELQIPLRLLDSAVRYRKSKDIRILLELPAEERAVLKSLLGIEEKSE